MSFQRALSSVNLPSLEIKPKIQRTLSHNSSLDSEPQKYFLNSPTSSFSNLSLLNLSNSSNLTNSSSLSSNHSKNHESNENNENPVKKTEVKAPNVEIYGFVAYLASFIGFGIFFAWSYLPENVLQQLGFTYYPKKYWAIVLPTYSLSMGFWILVFFAAINFLQTIPLDSIYTITDEHANIVDLYEITSDDKIPKTTDIPIGVVNKCLYYNLSVHEN